MTRDSIHRSFSKYWVRWSDEDIVDILYANQIEGWSSERIIKTWGINPEYLKRVLSGRLRVGAHKKFVNFISSLTNSVDTQESKFVRELASFRTKKAKTISRSPFLRHLIWLRRVLRTEEQRESYIDIASDFLAVTERRTPDTTPILSSPSPSPPQMMTAREALSDLYATTLSHTKGNKTLAAKILGIDPKTLYLHLKRSKTCS